MTGPSGGRHRKFKDLSLAQRLSILLAAGSVLAGFASVFVSIVALVVASNTKDIKSAIGNLSDLATQTKRQADNTSDQLGTLRAQLGESRAQTKAISEQTDAIKDTSTANIRAATAQQRMADVTAKAQTPNVDISELRVDGLTSEPKDGKVAATLFWRFRNTGGSGFVTKKVIYGVFVGSSLPTVMPTQLPLAVAFDGQDIVVTPTINSAFAPGEPLGLQFDVPTRDELVSNKKKLFFFARFQYEDGLKELHEMCFGREIILKDGNYYFAIPSGGPSYQCGR